MRFGLFLALLAVALPGLAHAHAREPAALILRARDHATYDASFRRPPQLVDALTPVFPAGCTKHATHSAPDADQRLDRFTVTCPRPLAGQTLHLAGLVDVSLSAIVYIEERDGAVARTLLTPLATSFTVPRRVPLLEVFRDYVLLGITHLATGLDHVLFIAGLCLLVVGVRRQLATLTAFTVGHSLTLSAATLDLLRLPQKPVEVAIALSLVALAHTIIAPGAVAARPWRMAFVFGLLHGLGFAGALADTGLPDHAIALSLAGFNLGVELGQLAVVLLLAPIAYFARRASPSTTRPLRIAAAYATGSLAAMWCIERAMA